MDGDSPPDTLPRRSQLPSSQSFTNLTSIQPAPKGRLISSVSNTSLNSNGTFKLIRRRKKKRVSSSKLNRFSCFLSQDALAKSESLRLHPKIIRQRRKKKRSHQLYPFRSPKRGEMVPVS